MMRVGGEVRCANVRTLEHKENDDMAYNIMNDKN